MPEAVLEKVFEYSKEYEISDDAGVRPHRKYKVHHAMSLSQVTYRTISECE